jgi:hypothetical protein
VGRFDWLIRDKLVAIEEADMGVESMANDDGGLGGTEGMTG